MIEWLASSGTTRWIAITALILSIASWVHTLVTQRKKLHISISDYQNRKNSILLFLKIENKSRLPIAISRIVLHSREQLIDCVSTSEWVRSSEQKDGPKIISHKNYYSLQFPVSISSLGGVGGYVLFQVGQHTSQAPSTPLTLEFYTNRGGPKKLSLPLPPESLD